MKVIFTIEAEGTEINEVVKMLGTLGGKKKAEAPGQIEMKLDIPVVESPVVEAAPVVEPPVVEETVDYESLREQIKALATQFVRDNKQEIGKEILSKVGAKKVSQVPDDKLTEILQAFKEA